MLKNRNIWLKAVAVIALSFPSLPVFAGAPSSDVKSPALNDLLGGSSYIDLVELPAPAALPEKAAADTKAASPAPGRDLSPKIDDQLRVSVIMKLITNIYQGNHLPYSQDGATFSNKEGHLPAHPRGFYKEYTLIVPGRKTGDGPVPVVVGGQTYMTGAMLSARGPERIIIGGGEKIYYTPNHYANFIELTVVN